MSQTRHATFCHAVENFAANVVEPRCVGRVRDRACCRIAATPSYPLRVQDIARGGTIDRRPLLGLVPCDFSSSMLLCVSYSTTANVSQDGTQSPSEVWTSG
ncbi:hypothetical protein E4U51_003199 [Claviceps purpurea]|nr:hypothetical protein E4U51_003199 [Claviceps purpurea]